MTKFSKNRHHFVQAAYLAKFACPQEKKGVLFAFSKANNKIFITLPIKVCVLKDLYKLVIELLNPNILEDDFAKNIESSFINILNNIQENSKLPSSKVERRELAKYISFTYFRNPKRFELLRLVAINVLENNLNDPKKIHQYFEDSRGIFDISDIETFKHNLINLIELIKDSTTPGKSDLVNQFMLKEILRDVASDKVKDRIIDSLTKFDTTDLPINLILDMTEGILSCFWILIKINDPEQYFLTSDDPTLIKTEKDDNFFNISTRLHNISLIFPLLPSLALVCSDYDYRLRVITATKDEVLKINHYLLQNCDKFVFSNNELFLNSFVLSKNE